MEARHGESEPREGNGYGTRALLLRLGAACLVAIAAIGARELILDTEPAPSETRGTKLVSYEIESELIDETLPVEVAIPPGARTGKRSLLVFLHGRGEDESSYLEEEMFEALVRQGGKAPVVAFPRSDPDSYWHDRDSGAWGSYVREELIGELVRRFDIEPERIAIGGISMGGFGAFDIAGRGPITLPRGAAAELCAVGGHSPAVWEQASDTAPGAFDDEADFEVHDVIEAMGPPASPLRGTSFWIDVGDEDPFADAAAELARQLEAGGAEGELVEGEGEHERAYWDSNWRRYMRFYAEALNECKLEAKAERQAEKQAAREGTDKDRTVRSPS